MQFVWSDDLDYFVEFLLLVRTAVPSAKTNNSFLSRKKNQKVKIFIEWLNILTDLIFQILGFLFEYIWPLTQPTSVNCRLFLRQSYFITLQQHAFHSWIVYPGSIALWLYMHAIGLSSNAHSIINVNKNHNETHNNYLRWWFCDSLWFFLNQLKIPRYPSRV